MTFRQFLPDTTEYQDALRLREDVLRTPLGFALTAADLARDAECFHLGGFDEAGLQAVLLLQPLDGQTLQMRQVAVRPTRQRTGVGMRLIGFAEVFARRQGYAMLVAHAREAAVAFYLRLGYTASGDEFIEQTIPHRLVTKELAD